jgi:autotransporter-associated beta strand protein
MTGTGKATLGGDVQFTGTSGTATITGNLDLGIAGRTFTIARGSAAEDMQVSANVTGGPSTGTAITKAGSGILAFSGANSYAGNTTVSAGTLIFGASGAFPNGNSLTINAGTARVSNLINANKILLQASSLAFGGSTGAWTGQLDLTSNDMIIHNGVIANIANQLKTGFNVSSGYWNGPGGIVSTSAASDSTHLTTLGYRTGGTPLDGVNTTSSDVLLMYTYYGDADLNGTVNGADYQQIDLGFGQHLTGWSNGDFNYDGVVDGSDYSLIDNTYNQINATGASPLAIIADPSDLIANPADATAVPEPTNLGLLGISATGLLRRRGRRKT